MARQFLLHNFVSDGLKLVFAGELQHFHPVLPPVQRGAALQPRHRPRHASDGPPDTAGKAERHAVHQPQVPSSQGGQVHV